MAWNGSGTYVLPPAFTPEVNGTTIDATRYNGTTNDLAAGITAALAKNGENVPTANLPMAGFKHTGAADGSVAGNYIAFNQATAIGSLTITTLNGTTFTATGVSSAAAFIPTSATIPTNGLYLKAANNPALASNTTLRWDVNSTGNHVFAAPSSGDVVLFNGPAGAQANGSLKAAAGQNSQFSVAGNALVPGTSALDIIQDSAGAARLINRSNALMSLYTNNTERIQVAATGNVTINAPSSGNSLNVNTLGQGVKITTNVARGGGLCYLDFFDPTGVKGELGFGASTDDFYVTNILAGSVILGVTNGGAGQLVLDSTGRVYGTKLHNNASSPTGTTNQYIASGTYTPTFADVSNTVSRTISGTWKWMRVGNVVSVWGVVTVVVGGGTGATEFTATLPIASNLAVTGDLAGSATNATAPATQWSVIANTASDIARILTGAVGASASYTTSVAFGYEVL